jgi:hypothetical protein
MPDTQTVIGSGAALEFRQANGHKLMQASIRAGVQAIIKAIFNIAAHCRLMQADLE